MTAQAKTASTIAVVAALAAGVFYGVMGTGSQILARQGFSISHIIVAQFLLGTIFLGILVLVKYHDFPSRKEILKLIGVGVLQPFTTICIYSAIEYITVGQAIAIQFQYIWITVLIQSILERTRPSKWVVGAAVVLIFGTFFASGVADEVFGGGGAPLNITGLLFAFGCAVFFSFFLYTNGKAATQTHPITRSFIIMLSGTVVCSILYFDFYTSGVENLIAITPGGAIMGIFAIAPVLCLSLAAKALPGGATAILISVELPAAIISGALALGDPVTVLMVVGTVIIIGGIVLSEAEGFLAKKKGPPQLE